MQVYDTIKFLTHISQVTPILVSTLAVFGDMKKKQNILRVQFRKKEGKGLVCQVSTLFGHKINKFYHPFFNINKHSRTNNFQKLLAVTCNLIQSHSWSHASYLKLMQCYY